VDNLACTSVQYDLTAALEMAAGANLMTASPINAMQQQAREAQMVIVTPNGKFV
jgi:hypothetical protein